MASDVADAAGPWQSCVVEYAATAVHVTFALVAVTGTACVCRGGGAGRTRRLYPCHDARFAASVSLLVVAVLWTTATALADHYSPAGARPVPPCNYLPPVGVFIAVTMSAVLYGVADRADAHRWLLSLLAYWLAATATHAALAAGLQVALLAGAPVGSLLLCVAWATAGLFAVLLVMELYLLKTQGRRMLRHRYHPTPASAGDDATREEEEGGEGEETTMTGGGSRRRRFTYRHERTSAVSRVTLWWMNPVLRRGYRRPLQMHDFAPLPREHSAEQQYLQFRAVYKQEEEAAKRAGRRPSLWRCYARVSWRTMVYTGVCKLFAVLLVFVGPWVIGRIIVFLSRTSTDADTVAPGNQTAAAVVDVRHLADNGYVLSLLLFLASLLHHTLTQSFMLHALVKGVHLRAAIQMFVYDKSLRLALWSHGGASTAPGSDAIPALANCDKTGATEMVSLAAGRGSHRETSGGNRADAETDGVLDLTDVTLLAGEEANHLPPPPSPAAAAAAADPPPPASRRGGGKAGEEHADAASARGTGEIFNHVATDANNVLMMIYLFHFAWTMPIEVSITAIYLYHHLGYSALVGLAIIIIFMPVQYKIACMLAKIQATTLRHADDRIGRTNELLLGVRTMKMLAWEDALCRRVSAVRRKELRALLRGACYRSLATFVNNGVPISVTLVSFGMYTAMAGGRLDPVKAFTSLALFGMLNIPLFMFPMVVSTLVNAGVSTRRLARFFASPEVADHQAPPPREVDDHREIDDHQVAPPREGDDHQVAPLREGTDHQEAPPREVADHQEALPCEVDAAAKRYCLAEKMAMATAVSPAGAQVAGQVAPSGDVATTSDEVARQAAPSSEAAPGDDAAEMPRDNARQAAPPAAEHEEDAAAGKPRNEPRPPPPPPSAEDAEAAVVIRDGWFAWDGDDACVLAAVDVRVSRARLTMIVGAVGSGKSSLLAAILGETRCVRGSVEFHGGRKGSIALCAQRPWLLNASVADNILFGEERDEARYAAVVQACALEPDIELLPEHDATEIGERGINLSGGQKHRICLARALYSRASLVVMDDPFSALDAHVGALVFERAVVEFLLRAQRTVILVTHQLQFLKHADKVLVLKAGRLTHQGSFAELEQQDCHLVDQLRAELRAYERTDRERAEADARHAQQLKEILLLEGSCGKARQRSMSTSSGGYRDGVLYPTPSLASLASGLPDTLCIRPLPQDPDHRPSSIAECTEQDADCGAAGGAAAAAGRGEERETGVVAARVWWRYAAACGAPLSLAIVAIYVGREVAKVATDFWVKAWASEAAQQQPYDNISSIGMAQVGDSALPPGGGGGGLDYYQRGYTLLSFTTILITLLSAVAMEYAGLRGARNLHNRLLTTIVHCPVRFFDTTPVGRIVNRFSSDLGVIDSRLPTYLQYLMRTVLMAVAALTVNAIIVPWFCLTALPLLAFYWLIQNFYRATSRELQRLDNVSRSPVFGQFSESLDGLVTIRAYRRQETFLRSMMKLIDRNNTAALFVNAAKVWLGVRLGYLSAVVVLVAAVGAISFALACGATVHCASMVGLALTYAIVISDVFNWVVLNVAETEMQMSSVERVVHYCQLPTEPQAGTAGEIVPSADWPTTGTVQINNASIRYADTLPPVVKNINLYILPGQKVGVCGRTGSGKSSLLLMLLRLADVCEGHVLVDGVDIRTVPLADLRSRVSIIPQDPYLFSGTVRYNLDPDERCSASELWEALELAQLKDVMSNLTGGLDAAVTGGGDNFSVGERQLLCLARAFLRRSRILLMDEPTAALDVSTISALELAMQTAFAGTTLITVAHRISTIMNFDYVVVLDVAHQEDGQAGAGEIVEQGEPHELMQHEDSLFYKLSKEQHS